MYYMQHTHLLPSHDWSDVELKVLEFKEVMFTGTTNSLVI